MASVEPQEVLSYSTLLVLQSDKNTSCRSRNEFHMLHTNFLVEQLFCFKFKIGKYKPNPTTSRLQLSFEFSTVFLFYLNFLLTGIFLVFFSIWKKWMNTFCLCLRGKWYPWMVIPQKLVIIGIISVISFFFIWIPANLWFVRRNLIFYKLFPLDILLQ